MSKRGFTLIELITSTAIMIVAIAATCMMLIEGQRFTRNSEEIINSNEGSRVAGEFIVSALRIAGMGAAAGVWINNAGIPRLISPIFGTDNISTEGFTDDIWMLIPDRRAFQDNNCQSGSGAAVSVVTVRICRSPSARIRRTQIYRTNTCIAMAFRTLPDCRCVRFGSRWWLPMTG